MGCMGTKARPSAWDLPRVGSRVQLSLEASPALPARAGPFPAAHSQGAARPRSYSSPRLCPRLGLAATAGPLGVLPQSGHQGVLGRTPLDLSPLEPVAALPLPSWPPRSTSPTPSRLPARHGARFPAPKSRGTREGPAGAEPGAWSHPHPSVCTPRRWKGTDPPVTPGPGRGIPSKQCGGGDGWGDPSP